MKSITLSNLCVAFFFCLSMKNVASLKCYDCESNIIDDKSCTNLDPSMLITCPEGFTVCRTLKAGNPKKGYSLIQRKCGNLMYENINGFVDITSQERTIFPGYAVQSMVCNSDSCNGAAAILKTFPTICLFTSAIMFLIFVY